MLMGVSPGMCIRHGVAVNPTHVRSYCQHVSAAGPHPQCEVGLWSHVGPTFVTAAEYPTVTTSHSCLPRALTDLGCVWGVTGDHDHVLALGPPLQSFCYCYIWDWVCWFTGHAHFYNAKLLSKVK